MALTKINYESSQLAGDIQVSIYLLAYPDWPCRVCIRPRLGSCSSFAATGHAVF